jgi:hypothetical protein
MVMRLSGSQFQQLQQAFLSAFPTNPALVQMVRFGLNEYLDAIDYGIHVSIKLSQFGVCPTCCKSSATLRQ